MSSLRCALFLLLLSFVLFSQTLSTSFVSSSNKKLKILAVFGHPGKSHFDVFKPILEELARRGHDLTVISHFPRSVKEKDDLPNYVDINLRNDTVGVFLNVVDLKKVDQSYTRIFSEMRNLRKMGSISCEIGLKNPRVLDLVQSREKFDVVLTESFNTDCFLSIVQKFDAPYIGFSSHQIMPWANSRLGNPNEAASMPSIFNGLPRPMNFLERLTNVLSIWFVTSTYDTWYYWIDQATAEEVYGPGVPDLREIGKKMSAILINTHHSLHGARPNLPNVIEIGGAHLPKQVNPLPKDIAEFLGEADEGVLYFNLGSMIKASSMSKEMQEMILSVVGSIPRKVIWKWEIDDLPHKPSNVMVRKWLPQFDILSHPKIKGYLGHGGLLGLTEGVYHGVPMVLLPVFGDQFHNAAAAEARGVAVVVKFNELNEHTLRHALDQIFNVTTYRENAQKLSKAYRDRHTSPLETAVWWTEYIARGNGLPYLKSEGANLPWYQRHLVDVAVFLLVTSLVLLCAVYWIVKLLLSVLSTSAKTKGNSYEKLRGSKKKD